MNYVSIYYLTKSNWAKVFKIVRFRRKNQFFYWKGLNKILQDLIKGKELKITLSKKTKYKIRKFFKKYGNLIFNIIIILFLIIPPLIFLFLGSWELFLMYLIPALLCLLVYYISIKKRQKREKYSKYKKV